MTLKLELTCAPAVGLHAVVGRTSNSKTNMKTAIELIAAERERQLKQEGWTPEHDDRHSSRELASAALGYVGHYVARAWTYTNELGMPGVVDGPATYREEQPPDSWPWDEEWWKPKDPMRDLVRAAALIAAEIDRLQRKASAPNKKLTDAGPDAPGLA